MDKLKLRQVQRWLGQLKEAQADKKPHVFSVSVKAEHVWMLSREERRQLRRQTWAFLLKCPRPAPQESAKKEDYQTTIERINALVTKLEEEPRAVLASSSVWSGALKNSTSRHITAGHLDELLMEVEDVRGHPEYQENEKLQCAAAWFLMELYSVYAWPEEQFPIPVSDHDTVKGALVRYLQIRDGIDAENVEKARREGGKESARVRKLLGKPIHDEILQKADKLRSLGREERDLPALLSPRFKKSTRQIRRIIKNKPQPKKTDI
jgi:hypothetical protein